MKPEPVFDLIAPIAIYHGADLRFEAKARAAIRELQQRWPSAPAANWQDYLEYAEPDDLPNILDKYKDAFREIVFDHAPGWTEFVDRWGAYGFKDERGQVVFSGDSSFQFPWYETEALLVERIQEHLTGVCT